MGKLTSSEMLQPHSPSALLRAFNAVKFQGKPRQLGAKLPNVPAFLPESQAGRSPRARCAGRPPIWFGPQRTLQWEEG